MDFGGVSCFSKNKLLGSASRASPRSSKRDDRHGAFCAVAFRIGFSQGYPALPTHSSILSRLMAACNGFNPRSPETNLRNEPEHIVRTERLKIVIRYRYSHSQIRHRYTDPLGQNPYQRWTQ